jgi:hypothetical protein
MCIYVRLEAYEKQKILTFCEIFFLYFYVYLLYLWAIQHVETMH